MILDVEVVDETFSGGFERHFPGDAPKSVAGWGLIVAPHEGVPVSPGKVAVGVGDSDVQSVGCSGQGVAGDVYGERGAVY